MLSWSVDTALPRRCATDHERPGPNRRREADRFPPASRGRLFPPAEPVGRRKRPATVASGLFGYRVLQQTSEGEPLRGGRRRSAPSSTFRPCTVWSWLWGRSWGFGRRLWTRTGLPPGACADTCWASTYGPTSRWARSSSVASCRTIRPHRPRCAPTPSRDSASSRRTGNHATRAPLSARRRHRVEGGLDRPGLRFLLEGLDEELHTAVLRPRHIAVGGVGGIGVGVAGHEDTVALESV